MARPSMKTEHVKSLEGEDDQKRRLEAILKTVSGELSIAQACEQLGIGEARFHALRKIVLQAALDSTAPKAAGRPPAPQATPDISLVKELEHKVEQLSLELQAAQLRTELALCMPGVLRNDVKKKA